jgi:hypothetical protein
MTITAWYMDDDEAVDRHEPHKLTEELLNSAFLDRYGVLSFTGLNNGVGKVLINLKF